MSTRILIGGALERLRELPAESVHCAVTSPPYWGLRSYEGDTWDGGDASCDHMRLARSQRTSTLTGGAAPNASNRMEGWPDRVCGKCGARRTGVMIGLEPTFDKHLERLVAVFREVRRVLRSDGTLWLNYGDAYAGSWGAQSRLNPVTGISARQVEARLGARANKTGSLSRVPAGLKPKDLMMMPARVALALQADGWWLRSEVVWHKPNPMPESCTDRPTSAHEKLYLLAKRATYFYDAEAVRIPPQGRLAGIIPGRPTATRKGTDAHDNRETFIRTRTSEEQAALGSNLRNVWTIATESFPDAHFATFPTALVEPCIRAGTSERGVCAACGAPWVREVENPKVPDAMRNRGGKMDYHSRELGAGQKMQNWRNENPPRTTGWRPSCECIREHEHAQRVPATVLDPFGGAGTVGVVAQRLGRDAILIEISPTYAAMARQRIDDDLRESPRWRIQPDDMPLFADVENA